MDNSIKKQTEIKIEKVLNGFIVYENYFDGDRHLRDIPSISTKKVFNTKKQLNKYINENM